MPATLTEPAVRLDGVTKRYRGGGGVFDVTLEIPTGQVFGFLGPNGAGKTTTMRLLLDLIRPDSGSISVLGLDARRDSVAVRRRLGYLPGELALYETLTGRELLTHFSHLRGGPGWQEIAALVDRFDLDPDRPIRSLSKGNKQKVGLVQALMGDPELLLLDEPTSGLDPLVQQDVHACIREAVADGRTVFLSSHVLSEVGAVADRVGIIRAGVLIDVEDVASLRTRALHRMEARFASPVPRDAFEGVPGVRRAEVDGRVARLELTGAMDAVVKAVAAFEVTELTVHEPDLEEVFLTFYEEPDRARA